MNQPKILVPLDFSELGEHALQTAGVLGRILNGTVTPFHAYIPVTDLDGFYYVGAGITPHEKHSEIEKVLIERLEESAGKHIPPGHLNPPLLDVGNPSRTIAQAANDFDLVVLSTHGRTGFSRILMGSVTEKVLRICNKPVVTVTSHSDPGDMSRLMVTTDFSENSFRVFPYANHMAEIAGSQIDLVHVISYDRFPDSDAAEEEKKARESEMEELIDRYFRNIRSQINPIVWTAKKSPHVEICRRAESVSYHMVFMSTVGRTGMEHLMMGSTTSHVVRNVSAAVFTYNPQIDPAARGKKTNVQHRYL